MIHDPLLLLDLEAPYINNLGQYSTTTIADNGALYSIDTNKRLCKNGNPIETSLKWLNTYKLRVNNTGKVLGAVESAPRKATMVIYNEEDKSIIPIPSPVKYQIHPEDINDLDWVVGSYNDGSGNFHGILWTPEFGTLILKNITPAAINNYGIIVGATFPIPGTGYKRGVIWNKGLLFDLSDMLKLDQDFSNDLLYVSEISDINDMGEMVGWGPNINNSYPAISVYIGHKD